MLVCAWTQDELCFMWAEAIISLTSLSLWWTWLGAMALQDMAMLMAPGPPAMFIFVNEAVMDHVRDRLDYYYTSIFHVIGFIAMILSVSRQSISAHYTENLSYHNLPFTLIGLYFFFASCQSLIYILVSLCHILWYYVFVICITSILYMSLIPPGKNSTAFDPYL